MCLWPLFPYYVASVSCCTTAVAQYFGCVGLRRSYDLLVLTPSKLCFKYNLRTC